MQPQVCHIHRSKKNINHFSVSQEQCLTTAVGCFMTELNGTVTGECEDQSLRIPEALEILEDLIKERSARGYVSTLPNEKEVHNLKRAICSTRLN